MYDRQPIGNIEEGILYFHFKFSFLSFWTLPVGGGGRGGVQLDDFWQRSLTVFFLSLEEHNTCQVPP